ncbi:MAG: hypothetical protein K6E37_07690 [Bacteroidales bacterium]|nr:hypothetical protein [Bacteroidales bacterium]
MRIEANRRMPDGSVRIVVPFHICLKGLECAVLCRDDEDYDALVKIIFLSARACNVIVVIYIVLSNHYHVSVLAVSEESADACGLEIKRRYSMWVNHKYGERGILLRAQSSALPLNDRWHIRNALAYIPRNALDNGCNIDTYQWSGYRAMFRSDGPENFRPVSGLTRREAKAIFHTGDILDGVPWLIDGQNALVPRSACDYEYLEQAFEHDQAFFLKTIGSLNLAETRYAIEEKPFNMLPDSELLKAVNDESRKWFGMDIGAMSLMKKYRLLPYVYRTYRTSVAQLARVFSISREQISQLLST